MNNASSNKTFQKVTKNDRNKPKPNPLTKKNIRISLVNQQPKQKITAKSVKKPSKLFDSRTFNLIFNRIDKSKYSQLPKRDIDQTEEERSISFLQTSIMLDVHSGKYSIDTKQVSNYQLHHLTTNNDTKKLEDYSNSSRNLLTSSTTKSQLSCITMKKKIPKITVIKDGSNKCPQLKWLKAPSQIKIIQLTTRNEKYSVSPKLKPEKQSTIYSRHSTENNVEMNKLIQKFYNKKGFKM